ncbi:hypothetical protein PSTG_13524 [Puccinia striiformis f. sp. tritici PST-78]|uniref:Uncharacterized protein n=1 Tax=Puccinia striiformis f. sp. tritici PST-78 TaxID=1165861 RepID=A0A0L0V1K1_9BASI|nr:hypothetical protein PSTG_13524 [Puccinia striiformis f. sp. tritici PST-78]
MPSAVNSLPPSSDMDTDAGKEEWEEVVMLDPALHQSHQPRQLFVLNEHQDFACELQPNVKQDHPNRHKQSMHVIHVKPGMFGENRIPYSDVARLIDMWQTTGVPTVSVIICKNCCVSKPSIPSTPIKKKERQIKKINSDISVVTNPCPPNQALHRLYETLRLHFIAPHPPHLYFYLDIATLPKNRPEQRKFMDTTEWPFDMMTSAGVTGIWLQDDADNSGWACLMSAHPSTIAGTSRGTSWVMYSRTWTTEESEYVHNSIKKISKDHPDPPGELTFNQMHAVGSLSPEDAHKPPRDLHPNQPHAIDMDQSAPNDLHEFTLLESNFHCHSDCIRFSNLALCQTKKSDVVSDKADNMSTRADIVSTKIDIIFTMLDIESTQPI